MRRSTFLALIAVFCLCEISFAQRTIGGRRFQLDDGAGRVAIIDNFNGAIGMGINAATASPSSVLDLSSTSRGFLMPRMTTVQRNLISLPATGLMIYNTDLKTIQFQYGTPASPLWDIVMGLNNMALPQNNIWVGDASNIAQPLAPIPGRVMMTDPTGKPIWGSILPVPILIPANQITSGTLAPGTNLVIGPGSSITPTGGGTIQANNLSGAGNNRYSGQVAIPNGATSLSVPFTGILAGASVNVSVFDPQAGMFGFVAANVSTVTAGAGFTVIFAANYPNSGTGILNYTVVNP